MSRPPRVAAFLPATGALLALAGCTGPEIARPDLTLPAAFEAPVTDTASEIDLARWWLAYDDPVLTRLVEQALAAAPDAKLARARLAEATAVRKGALSAYAPQGGLQASAVRADTRLVSGVDTLSLGGGIAPISVVSTGLADTDQAEFAVSWEVDLFGRGRATRRKADADLAAARFEEAASRASLAAAVADLLFQTRGLQLLTANAHARTSLERQRLDLLADRVASGIDRRADVDALTAEVEAAAAGEVALEADLSATRRSLLVLIGRGVTPSPTLSDLGPLASPPPLPRTTPGLLLARRPDVREAAERLAAASQQLKLDELALFPSFTLLPGEGLNSGPGLRGPTATSFWSLGLAAAEPVLDLPRLKTVIRARGAQADQAAYAYEKAVQTAYGEAENALTELASDARRVALFAHRERQAGRNLDAARDRKFAGIEGGSATLEAELKWRAAQADFTEARVQGLRRSVQTFKALGGGWS